MTAGHLLGSVLVAGAVGWILWWVSTQSTRCAVLLATGIALRACIGLALFCISYYHLPIAQSLQSGGGFWQVAPDARTYYRMASFAAEHGFADLPRAGGSPAFVMLLALWMRLVGESPAAGFFMNIAAYVCITSLVVARFRPARAGHEWPCLLVILSYTFSPALLIHGSQPLKDELFVYILAAALLGASVFLPRVIDGARKVAWPGSGVLGLGAIVAAVYVIAGIRIYYAFILWAALATVLLAGVFRQRLARLLQYFAMALATLTVLWISYSLGAGATSYSQLVTVGKVRATGLAGLSSFLLLTIQNARLGFQISPGGTNLDPLAANASISEEDAPAGSQLTGSDELLLIHAQPTSTARWTALGLAALAVPISLLRALGVVHFNGGRGLLLIADIDTIFIEFTVLAGFALLGARFRHVKRNWAFALTAVLVGGVTAVLLGYVVTNYGALFRLRLIATMPIWLLPLAAIDDQPVERTVPSSTAAEPAASSSSVG